MAALVSENGLGGRVSSLGSTMDTWSGRGLLGPILPVGSQGNIILTYNREGVSPVNNIRETLGLAQVGNV